MSFTDAMMSNVLEAMLDEPPLLVLPSLAVAVGLNEAIVLQQLHYRGRDAADGWWRAGPRELWNKFPFWSQKTVRRTLTALRSAGLIEVRQESETNRTNHYRINPANKELAEALTNANKMLDAKTGAVASS